MPTKLNTPDIVKDNTVVESTKSKLNKPKIVINLTESNQNIEPQVNANTPQMRSVYDTLLEAYDTGTVGFMDKKPVEEKSNTIKFPDEVKIRTSYAGDVVDFEKLPTTKKEGVTGNTLLDNTVVPVLYGIGDGAGGGAITKALNGYDQEELDRRKALAAKQIGRQNTNLVRAGTTTSAVATPIVLTSMGVPAPLAYAETSMLNKAGQTDDPLDWGVAGAKGAAWGALTNGLSKINAGALGQIPATNTNLAANAAKNYLSPFAAATTSNYLLGTAEDAYNKARGREVENPTTLSGSAQNALLYAGIQGTKGLLGDIRTSKAQMQADIKNVNENIEAYKRQMTKDTEHSTEAFKQKLAANRQEKINAEIDKLSKNKYLAGKNDLAKAVEALRLGNKPQVEMPKAMLSLPQYAGQGVSANNVQNVSQMQETMPQSENISQNTTNLMQKVENSPNALYNQGRGEINGARIIDTRDKSANDERKNELAQLIETERANSENLAKTIKTKNFSSKSNMINKYEKEHNSTISLIDGDQSSFTDSQGNMYLNEQQVKDYGEEQLLKHETVENLLNNHTDDVIKEFSPLVDEIKRNEKGLTAMYKLYSSGLTSKESQVLALNIPKLTKEIFCDFNASVANNETANDLKQTLIDNFGEDLYKKVISTIQEKENQIYGQKNSNKSSFSMPENEEIYTATNKSIQEGTNKAIEDGARILTKPNESLSTYKKQMFQNNANAINDLIQQKNDTLKEFDNKIAQKKQELAGKKDQTTKIAQTLRTQITNLEKRRSDAEAKFVNKIDRLENHNANINKLKNQVSENKLPTRAEVKENIISEKGLEDLNLDDAKDINKFVMNNTIPARVNEKVFNPDTATKINDRFFKPIKVNEANRTRFLNKEREEIRNWGIEPKSKESAAVQMYGEGEYVNPSTGESSPYTLTDLKREFPNDWEKIKIASEKARAKYDNYIDTINKELNKMGYDSIPKLKNYFRHFEQTKDLIEMFGIPGKANKLPTDLNGLTADLKPGKTFFSNALKRTGNKTDYDAITGIDGYLEGASKLMYHTEDIQNLRTLEEFIRNKYGSKADLEGLSKQEFDKRVGQIQGGHLSEYASWLTEYTNNLSGKKSMMDRGTENAFGRRVYGTLNALKKQVGSNLTGLNVNSALSNFISAGQGLSSTSKLATIQGLIDTLKSIAKQDDFINKSDFLTTRFGSDKLSKTLWEKASNAGQIFMSGTDYFTANLITRSKYHEFLNKGYPEQEAIEKAGEYADRLMAGRGLGDMPNFFNSKTLGILTQFQLENVNQFDSMFHDNFTKDRAAEQTKYEAKTWNEKIKSKIASDNPKFYNGFMSTFVLAQLFAAGWAFNKIVNKLGGTGGAFDPIGTVEDFVKDYQKEGLQGATSKLAKNVLDDIPYANIVTGGGRIPMKDSLPNLYDILTGESTVSKEGTKLLNVIPPTGGGQLRKTFQGAKTFINDGEYGKRDGKEYAKWILDMENKSIPDKLKTSAQSLIFGKYGPEEAKKYIENNYKGMTVTETDAYKEAKKTGMSAKEFSMWIDVLKKINPKKTDKDGKERVNTDAKKSQLKQKLNNSNLTEEQKKIMYGIFYSVK